jgi:hypothetical protein
MPPDGRSMSAPMTWACSHRAPIEVDDRAALTIRCDACRLRFVALSAKRGDA